MKKLLVLFTISLFSFGLMAQDAEKFFNEAEAKSGNGDYKASIALYTKAIEADPDYTNAYLRRAFAYAFTKDYEKTVADYTKVIESNADHTFAYQSRGSAYNKLEKYDLAMKDFDKVLTLDSKGLLGQEAYNNRGFAKKAKGDLKAACEDWKKSKKLGNAEAKLIIKNNHCK